MRASGILPAPVFSGLNGQSRGPRIDISLFDGPAILVRLASMEAGTFHPDHAIRQPERDDIVRDVRGILLMVPKRSHRIFKRGSAVRVSDGSDRGIAHRGKVERQERMLFQLEIIKRGHFHEEIMRVLAVGDGVAATRFPLAEMKEGTGGRLWWLVQGSAWCGP